MAGSGGGGGGKLYYSVGESNSRGIITLANRNLEHKIIK